jgi:hypothetical protein
MQGATLSKLAASARAWRFRDALPNCQYYSTSMGFLRRGSRRAVVILRKRSEYPESACRVDGGLGGWRLRLMIKHGPNHIDGLDLATEIIKQWRDALTKLRVI